MSDLYKDHVSKIEYHLMTALTTANQLQATILEHEGDSDFNRKLAFYLIPNLNQWVLGAQAGGVKDLKDLLVRRGKEVPVNVVGTSKEGDGFNVLTDPEK